MAAEYFTMEHESVGLGNSTLPCTQVAQGHKHDPHIHDRYGTGDTCCQGYPKQQLLVLPRS